MFHFILRCLSLDSGEDVFFAISSERVCLMEFDERISFEAGGKVLCVEKKSEKF